MSTAAVDPAGAFMTHFIGMLNVPGPVKTVLHLVETGFWIGRKVRNLVFTVENPHVSIFGAFLNDQLSTNSFVRVVAYVVHLARIITDFSRKTEDFVRALWHMKIACLVTSIEFSYFGVEISEKDWTYVQGNVPQYLEAPWPVSYVRAKIQQIFIRIIEMLYTAYEVVYSLFELHEALSANPEEGVVGILPMEISRLAESFAGREWEMGEAIMEYEEVIDRIFAASLLPWSARRLAETLKTISVGARVVNLVMHGPAMVSQQIDRLAALV